MDEGAFNRVNLCIGDYVAKVFCCESKYTGLPYAEEHTGAGSDASESISG